MQIVKDLLLCELYVLVISPTSFSTVITYLQYIMLKTDLLCLLKLFLICVGLLFYFFGVANPFDLFVNVGCCKEGELVCDYESDMQRHSKSAVKCKNATKAALE